jgi:hypothetical protein
MRVCRDSYYFTGCAVVLSISALLALIDARTGVAALELIAAIAILGLALRSRRREGTTDQDAAAS